MKYNFENKIWTNEVNGKTYEGTFETFYEPETFKVVDKKGWTKAKFETEEGANKYLTERRKAWGWKIVHKEAKTRIIHDYEMNGNTGTPWTNYNMGKENG